jgi:hypothetical protein
LRCWQAANLSHFCLPAYVEVAWVEQSVEFAYARFDVTALEYNFVGLTRNGFDLATD